MARRWIALLAALLVAVPVAAAAEEPAEPAIQASPLAAAHLKRSRELKAQGKTAEAGAELEKALQLTSRIPSAHFQRAELLLEQGKLDEALAEYTRAIEALALKRYLR